MRVVLFTGKGGVGKTTCAAATAAHSAYAGRKTLVISTDPAHSLADVFGVSLGDKPAKISDSLSATQLDADKAIVENWAEIRDYAYELLTWLGLETLAAEQILTPPGTVEICALLALEQHASSGVFDAIIVDCAPTADTLRLLALPERLTWYAKQFVTRQRGLGASLRSLLSPELPPTPTQTTTQGLRRLYTQLGQARELLVAPTSSLRLVTTAEAVVLEETRRTFTALNMYGFTVDALVVNRLIPDDGNDVWRLRWARNQRQHLERARDSFGDLPIFTVPYLLDEPIGLQALHEVSSLTYGDVDPLVFGQTKPAVMPEENGEYVLELPLPLVDRADVLLSRIDDELVINWQGQRRVLVLPEPYRQRTVSRAYIQDSKLRICFSKETNEFVEKPILASHNMQT